MRKVCEGDMDYDVTEQDIEALVILMEEAGEVIQACSKIIRHGWNSHDPTLPVYKRVSNQEHLAKEVGHFDVSIERLYQMDRISSHQVLKAYKEKNKTGKQWLHTLRDI